MLNILPFRHQRNLNFSSLDDTRQLHSTLSTLIFKHFSVWRGSHSACISTIHAALKRQKFLVSIISSTWIILECFFAFFSLRAGNVAFVEKELEKKTVENEHEGKTEENPKANDDGKAHNGRKEQKKSIPDENKNKFSWRISPALVCEASNEADISREKKARQRGSGVKMKFRNFILSLRLCVRTAHLALGIEEGENKQALKFHTSKWLNIIVHICELRTTFAEFSCFFPCSCLSHFQFLQVNIFPLFAPFFMIISQIYL